MPSPVRSEPYARRIHRSPYPAVLTTLILGIALSVLGSWVAYSWEKDRVELAFERATAAITGSVEDCFLHQIDNARAVVALYEASTDSIGRTQFSAFVEPLISRCEALVGVHWAPRVPGRAREAFERRAARERHGYAIVEYDGAGRLVHAGEREVHFPILYGEPRQVSWYPEGLDLASRANEGKTIEYVLRTRRMAFVPHEPTRDAQSPVLEVLFHPVYRSSGPSTSNAAARQPVGLVIGLSRLSAIVDEAFQNAGNPPLGVDVQEVLTDGTRQMIYSRPSASAGSASGPWEYLLPPLIEPRETQFLAADRALVLRFAPNHGAYSVHPGWLPLIVIVSGLVFTACVAVYLDRTKQRTERIRELVQRLSEGDIRKNEFLAVLGHELRNPLVPISNAVQILRAKRVPSAATLEWAEGVIERQVTQLARLVDDLLDVARITRGDIALRDERVDLREVVQRAVETERPLIDTKRHVLRDRLPSEPVPVRGDRARLIQVVGNLLDNAAKYTPDGGRIDVELLREGNEVRLSVRDSGIGIPPEFLPGVFDLFHQAPVRDRHATGGGLGLGLGLARRLIEMHGGRIEAASAGEGAGSQFTVRLAVSTDPAETGPDPRPPARARESRRVLVVEDNLDVALSFQTLLETMGHQVAVAHDGPAALDVARSVSPEIAFVDIGLPGMDGYEVARRLREQRTPPPYLIAITGYGQARDRERAAMAGFDRHLVKPVDVAVLEEALSSAPVREALPS